MPYFSSKAFPPVCVMCGTEVDGDGGSGGNYPMCTHCCGTGPKRGGKRSYPVVVLN